VSENPNLLNTEYFSRYYILNKEKQQVDLRIMSEGEKPYLSKVLGGSSPLQEYHFGFTIGARRRAIY
jgi:hypothetical protein